MDRRSSLATARATGRRDRRPERWRRIKEAERLGFDSVWTAEAYGSDALTPLAWWGAHTERIRLGTGIVQLSARTPAATAMAAITLDHLSGGRFILGLGASGPQVVEGWYGQPYPRPLARTREYVDIIRRIVARGEPRRAPRRVLRPPAGRAAPGSASRSSRPSTRCAPTSRSSSPPRARRTSPSPPRSATAGCRCSSPRRRTASTVSASPRASRRAATPARPTDFEVVSNLLIVPGDDVERCADVDPPVPRPLRRRHGRPRRQLPLRGVRPHGLRGRRHQGAGAVPRRAQGGRRGGRSHWPWSRTSPSSARPRRSATS